MNSEKEPKFSEVRTMRVKIGGTWKFGEFPKAIEVKHWDGSEVRYVPEVKRP